MSNNKKLKISNETVRRIVSSARSVGHYEAAKGQMEQAIFLWFHKDWEYVIFDETSIHTLASAVQGILWAYAHDSRQQPSRLAQMIESNPGLSRIKDPQNFFKHGNTGRKEKGKHTAISHLPSLTDLFLADNVITFNRLFMKSSSLMDAFILQYSLTFPESGISLKTLEMKLVGGGYNLEALARLDRKSFYDLVIPYAVANLRDGQRGAIQGSPP